MTDQPIDHDVLDDALKRCGSSWNAGQVHGLLCSRLTVSGSEGATRWFEQVLNETDPNNALRAECEQLLDSMCATTWRQLVERQSEFTLLLPHDEDAALKRAESMAQWCEGYLHGLVSEKHRDALKEKLAAEPVADIIKDMLQFTRATADDDGDNEGNEDAYVELVEYLRVAVQLVYEELADFRSRAEDNLPDDNDTLH
jgi:yecA family protein